MKKSKRLITRWGKRRWLVVSFFLVAAGNGFLIALVQCYRYGWDTATGVVPIFFSAGMLLSALTDTNFKRFGRFPIKVPLGAAIAFWVISVFIFNLCRPQNAIRVNYFDGYFIGFLLLAAVEAILIIAHVRKNT